jgi:hypothetical protein
MAEASVSSSCSATRPGRMMDVGGAGSLAPPRMSVVRPAHADIQLVESGDPTMQGSDLDHSHCFELFTA